MGRRAPNHGLAFVVVAALVGCGTGCKSGPQNPPPPGAMVTMTDAQLIQAVRAAAAAKASVQDVDARVGTPAIINTTRPGDRNKYLFGHLELDTQESSEIASLKDPQVKDLAYWKRPVSQENVPVVGIAWLTDGSDKVFFAVVYPPE